MKNPAKVHMLPTKQITNLIFDNQNNNYLYGNFPIISTVCDYQHLHCTSDEEPKEGDWCIVNGGLGRIGVGKYQANVKYSIKPLKIVATTDESIGYTDNQISPVSNFCTYPQPSQQFIEEYAKAGGKIDKVLLEYYTKTLMKPSDVYLEEIKTAPKLDQNNCVIIHPVEPKLYTLDEIGIKIKECFEDIYSPNATILKKMMTTKVDNWIKENLK